LARGWVYEPASLCEKNAAAIALEKTPDRQSKFSKFHKKWSTDAFHPVHASHPMTKEKA
jgi:hypothetical protein